MNYTLQSDQPLTQLVQNHGIHDWEALTTHTQQIPYGRNSNRTDFFTRNQRKQRNLQFKTRLSKTSCH